MKSEPVSLIDRFEIALGAILLSAVWLVPNHQLPWTAFHHEILMGVSVAIICILCFWQRKIDFNLPAIGVWVFAFAFFPFIQFILGIILKQGQMWVSSGYLAAIAISIAIGFVSANDAKQKFWAILAWAIVIAATLNVPIQIVQWKQWYNADYQSLIGFFVTAIPATARPSGNILQPNQLATLQVWAMIGVTWLFVHRELPRSIWIAFLSALSFGLILTQSRTGLLEVLIVSLTLCLWAIRSKRKDVPLVWMIVFLTVLISSLNFEHLSKLAGVSKVVEARVTNLDGARIDAYKAFVQAIYERPILGYGISDSGFAYVSSAQSTPEIYIGQRFAHAHNLFIDLALWVGLPLAILIAVYLIVWLIRRACEIKDDTEMIFPWVTVTVLGIHAMLELPHQFLYFSVPAGFYLGWMTAKSPVQVWQICLPRVTWFVFGIAGLTFCAMISKDYFPLQDRYTEWRYSAQKVGNDPFTPIQSAWIANQIEDELLLYRMKLTPSLSPDVLKWVSETAGSTNSPYAYYIAAKAFALNNQRDESKKWMMRFNAIMTRAEVQNIKKIWTNDQIEYPTLAAFSWPEYGGRESTWRFESTDQDLVE